MRERKNDPTREEDLTGVGTSEGTVNLNSEWLEVRFDSNSFEQILNFTKNHKLGFKRGGGDKNDIRDSEKILFDNIKDLLNYSSLPKHEEEEEVEIYDNLKFSRNNELQGIHHEYLFKKILQQLIINNIYYKNIGILKEIIDEMTSQNTYDEAVWEWISAVKFITNIIDSTKQTIKKKGDGLWDGILLYLIVSKFIIKLHIYISTNTKKQVNTDRSGILNLFLKKINDNKTHTLAIRIRDDLNSSKENVIYIDDRGIPIYISEQMQNEENHFKVLSSLFGNNVLSKLLLDNQYKKNIKLPLQHNDNDQYNKNLTTFLTDKPHTLLFTYGASGSGKTYYTIGSGGETKGLANHLLDTIIKKNTLRYIEIQELIPNYKIDKNVPDENICKGLTRYKKIIYDRAETKEFSINSIVKEFDKENDNRLTYYTPNNPDSSRSHLVIKLIYYNGELDEKSGEDEKTWRSVSIVDLAGLEAPIKAGDQFDKGHQVLPRKVLVDGGRKPIKLANKSFYYPKYKVMKNTETTKQNQKTINSLKTNDLIIPKLENNDYTITFLSLRPNKLSDIYELWKNIKIILKQIKNDTNDDLFIDGEDLNDIFDENGEFNSKLQMFIELVFKEGGYIYTNSHSTEDFHMNLPEEAQGRDVEMDDKGNKYLIKKTDDEDIIKNIKKKSYYRNLKDFTNGIHFDTIFNNYKGILEGKGTQQKELLISSLVAGKKEFKIVWCKTPDGDELKFDEIVLGNNVTSKLKGFNDEKKYKTITELWGLNLFFKGASRTGDLERELYKADRERYEFPEIIGYTIKEGVSPYLIITIENFEQLKIKLKYKEDLYFYISAKGGSYQALPVPSSTVWKEVYRKNKDNVETYLNAFYTPKNDLRSIAPSFVQKKYSIINTLTNLFNAKVYDMNRETHEYNDVDNGEVWETFANKAKETANIGDPENIKEFKNVHTELNKSIFDFSSFEQKYAETSDIKKALEKTMEVNIKTLQENFERMWNKIAEPLKKEEEQQKTIKKNEEKKLEINEMIEKNGIVNKMANLVFDIYIYMNRLYEGKLIQDTLTYITFKMKDINKREELKLNYWNPKCENIEQLSNLDDNNEEDDNNIDENLEKFVSNSINFEGNDIKIMTILVYFISKTINNTAFNKLYINIEDYIEIEYMCKELTKIVKDQQSQNIEKKLKMLHILIIYISKSNISIKSDLKFEGIKKDLSSISYTSLIPGSLEDSYKIYVKFTINSIITFTKNFNTFIKDNYLNKYKQHSSLDNNLITFLKTGNRTSNEISNLKIEIKKITDVAKVKFPNTKWDKIHNLTSRTEGLNQEDIVYNSYVEEVKSINNKIKVLEKIWGTTENTGWKLIRDKLDEDPENKENSPNDKLDEDPENKENSSNDKHNNVVKILEYIWGKELLNCKVEGEEADGKNIQYGKTAEEGGRKLLDFIYDYKYKDGNWKKNTINVDKRINMDDPYTNNEVKAEEEGKMFAENNEEHIETWWIKQARLYLNIKLQLKNTIPYLEEMLPGHNLDDYIEEIENATELEELQEVISGTIQKMEIEKEVIKNIKAYNSTTSRGLFEKIVNVVEEKNTVCKTKKEDINDLNLKSYNTPYSRTKQLELYYYNGDIIITKKKSGNKDVKYPKWITLQDLLYFSTKKDQILVNFKKGMTSDDLKIIKDTSKNGNNLINEDMKYIKYQMPLQEESYEKNKNMFELITPVVRGGSKLNSNFKNKNEKELKKLKNLYKKLYKQK